MKKYILIIGLFIAFLGTTFSQEVTVEEKAKKATEKLEKDISLTEEQKSQVYELNVTKIKAQDELRAAAGKGNKPDAEEMKVVSQKFTKAVNALLTKEQKEAWTAIKAQPKKQ